MAQKNIWLKKMARYVRTINHVLCSDEKYLKRKYKKEKGKEADLDSPRDFSEKLLFLMLHYRNPLENLCADKYYVQEYVKACGYGNILKKIYGVYRNANDIDFRKLPDEFFIKTNHVSGNNKIVKKVDNPNYKYLRKFYAEVLKLNYYFDCREWVYDRIRPMVICEEVLRDKNGNLPIDYKFYCFGGKMKYFMVSCGEFEHQVRNHKFDRALHSIDYHFKKMSTLSEEEARSNLPDNIDDMFKIVDRLCKPFPHVRVDLYNVDGKIYFGELTFFSSGGIVNIYDRDYDQKIASWIDLTQYKDDMV
ncbi:ATP-grasp fold amidoligase family protein [Clostridium fessum]|uniref:ATP-grasp fold amidoligase family protein n=1 Tax=Clostridium fessum TaxID=2126740 RepID=UPI0022E7B27A|nr:ATP-grasp fold amidoligase family protein [Clostridium fessum]